MVNLDHWLSRTAYPPGDRSAEAQRRIDKMRSIYDSTLRDVCIPQTRVANADTRVKAGYTDGSATACLFQPVAADETEGAQAQGIVGEIRLPRSVDVTTLARVKVTKSYGTVLAVPQVFEIVGGPIRTHIGYTMKVRLVTDGSES